MSYILSMKGDEFVRKIRRLGKSRGIEVRFEKRHGKGSHGTHYFGDRKTIVKDRRTEIGEGLLRAMLGQPGLGKSDFK